ncbi:MAG: hypothetical protein B7733_18230 [Myxococcales bacterium FL481]|nr:MAG: hypothetical protein B7733_18230 [Myxococcales bacterium FL481]
MTASPMIPRALAVSSLVGLLGACQEPPSYRLRWGIEQRDNQTRSLTRRTQCSEVGLDEVWVQAFATETAPRGADGEATEDGTEASIPVAEQRFPCFPRAFQEEQAMLDGPALDAGTYELVLTGLVRGQRSYSRSEVRTEPFVVEENATIDLDPVYIPSPTACEDGLDNDEDGLVDLVDPSCQDNPAGDEHTAVHGFTRVAFKPTFFNEHPQLRCRDLDVPYLAIKVDGQAVECLPCNDQYQVVRLTIDPAAGRAAREIAVVAARPGAGALGDLASCAEELSQPVASTTFYPGASLQLDVDFDRDDFLNPIVRPLSGFVLFRGDADDDATLRSCRPPSHLGGNLAIDTVRLRVLDDEGLPLGPELLHVGQGTVDDDGSLTLPCRDVMQLTSDPLHWGRYQLELEGLSNGTACFASGYDHGPGPVDLHPAPDPVLFVAGRIVDEAGLPPPSCRECDPLDDQQDCSSCADADCCVDHVCQSGP